MTLFLLFLLSPLMLVNLVLGVEIATGLKRGSRPTHLRRDFSAVIVIPAHDEAPVIGRTLNRLKQAIDPNFAILVVADNCSDDTAAIARSAGVQVVERHDADNRGKGHALAFARDQLRAAPPAIVVVLDADCHTDRESLNALAGSCARTGRPCQAINLLEAQGSAPPMVQISTFAFLLKNLIRQRGLAAVTGGVHLTGTGMCLSWEHFERADLATSSIVEDVRLGLEMTRAGHSPFLVETAFVWSPPSDVKGTLTQRGRWEGGLLAMARQAGPRAIWHGVRHGSPKAVFSALDLMVPPLALLVLLNIAALALSITLAIAGWTDWSATVVMSMLLAMLAMLILTGWWREGRAFLTPSALVKLPAYVLWKVPMYLALAIRGAPREWRQSERPPQKDP